MAHSEKKLLRELARRTLQEISDVICIPPEPEKIRRRAIENYAEKICFNCRIIEEAEMKPKHLQEIISEIEKMTIWLRKKTDIDYRSKDNLLRIYESCVYRLKKRLTTLQFEQKPESSSSEEDFGSSVSLEEHFGEELFTKE